MRQLRPADYVGAPATVGAAIAAGDDLRDTGWGLRDAVIALAGALVFALTFASIVAGARSSPAGSLLIVGAAVPWFALIGWPVWATAHFGNGVVIDLGFSFRWSDLGWGVIGGIVSLALGSLAAELTARLIGGFDSAADQAAADVASSAPRWQLIGFALVVAVGAPVAEELAFRGMLWAGLCRLGMRPLWTLVTTTVVFAVFHFEPSRIAVLLVIGAVFGFLRLRTQRLGSSIIAHGCNNLPGAVSISLM